MVKLDSGIRKEAIRDNKMDTIKMHKRLESYIVTYYSELRKQISDYPAIKELFPEFLKGAKRVTAFLCNDGVLMVHWPAEEDSFTFEPRLQLLNEITKEIPSAPNVVGRLDQDFDLQIGRLEMHEGPDTTGPIVWRAPWDRVELSGKFGTSRWGIDSAKTSAMNDVLTFIASNLMEMRTAQKPDIISKLRDAVKEFEDLLKQNPPEEAIQTFLTKKPVILSPTAFKVFPKYRLGSEHVPDFIIHQANGEYILVEIEASTHNLFTKKGDPSAPLTHAQRQVEDWREWISENIAYAQQSLPEISDPVGWVIIGRSTAFSGRDRKALRRKNKDLSRITIMTYDDLLTNAQRHLENLSRL